MKEEDVDSFENRCNDLSDEDFSYLFGCSESEPDVFDTEVADAVMDLGDELQKSEEDELILKDSVARFQFDYHANTCFANDVPEISVNENDGPKAISIAPGEGKVPKDILQDKDWDMRAFPALDPTGENSLNCQRTIKMTYQQFFQQRIFNIDRRFANCPSFVFAATMYTENKQLTGNMNIAFNGGKATKTDDGGTAYYLQDPSTVLDNIKGNLRYFRKKKNEFIAKLENHGPFQFFLHCPVQTLDLRKILRLCYKIMKYHML